MSDDPRTLKQRAVDNIAELLVEADERLVKRNFPWQPDDTYIETLERDINTWVDRVHEALGDRRFFSRADQLHFDCLGLRESKEYKYQSGWWPSRFDE